MKRLLVLFCVIMLVPTLVFAGERITHREGTKKEGTKGGISVQSFANTDISFEQAHMCTFTSLDCDVPEKVTFGQPTLHIVVFVPVTQGYTRHYIVSDPAGTFSFYTPAFSSLMAGFNTLELDLDPLFPVGDYTFTAIVVGNSGIAAVSDQYRFSVR